MTPPVGDHGHKKVNVGTRKSQLAIAQVDSIIAQLKAVAPQVEYQAHVVSTMADENQVKSFSAFDSKSIWTEELEQLLADKKLDVVVHCLKGNSVLHLHDSHQPNSIKAKNAMSNRI